MTSTHLPTALAPAPRTRRTLGGAAAAVLVGGLALTGAATAQAAPAPPEPTATDGWARVAHLSPDTKAVDVELTALAGGAVLYELEDVAYGQVSDYLTLPAGTYVVSMVPSDAPEGTDPAIEQSLTVTPGEPVTVAAYGRNAALRTAVYEDDLTNPADGESRIRVVQASTVADSVDVTTSTGTVVTEGATPGAATGYATVPAGAWTLELGGDASGTAQVDLAGGTVSTLLVLDTADRSQTVAVVLDAAAPGATPAEGVDTGGGWGAATPTTTPAPLPVALTACAGLLGAGGVVLALRRVATAAAEAKGGSGR
ncbi:DUF4397 domain-containing protein [Cellulomonas pakistanensis]|uniref:DUF4397 domain-containing protein n=1 Tax=Cellulomonas pakistanensis TaxID=992287 RepID=A0A919P8U1_9CELL|nr:DUF4397 domain-containing protein [Cellulomonas pakistanensis]GIG36494.1 hypothetical protein Cpa01nite_18750 [Cellulomonas pakistanensis]